MTKTEFFESYRTVYEDISATLGYTAGIDVDLLRGQPILVLENGAPVTGFIQSVNTKTQEVVYYKPPSNTTETQSYLSDWIFMKLFKKGSIYEGLYDSTKPGHVKSSTCECGAEKTYGVGCNKRFHSFWCKSDKVYKRS